MKQIQTDDANNDIIYDFEHIVYKSSILKIFRNNEYQLQYQFTTSTMKRLTTYFDNLSIASSIDTPSNTLLTSLWFKYNHSHSMRTIRLGRICCEPLDLISLVNFIRACNNKANLILNVDWDQIVFQNTAKVESDNAILRSLVTSFGNYGLIARISPLLHITAFQIKKEVVTLSSSDDFLLVLKRFYDEGIHFGLTEEIAALLYQTIDNNEWITRSATLDASYANVVILSLWFTQRTLFRHHDLLEKTKFIDDETKKEFLDNFIPEKVIVIHDPTVMNRIGQSTTVNVEVKEESESDFTFGQEWHDEKKQEIGTYDDEYGEEGSQVDFEILECFKYFQPQIESYLIN
eukprot:272178_1